MQNYPTETEIDTATDLLVNQYKISSQLLGQLFGLDQRDQANSILQSLGSQRLKAIDVAKLLLQKEGSELFTGSTEPKRELRLCLLKGIQEDKLRELYKTYIKKENNGISVSRMAKALSERKWYSGKDWANDFVLATRFPLIFSGVVKKEKVPTIMDVDPKQVVPDLVDFQRELKNKMLEVLKKDGNKTRCIVTLPTGGGKTRVAVEAFIDWMQPRFSEGKYLIWIAQSEELCEQAIACIQQMWEIREFVSKLRIYRYFGGRELPSSDDLVGGVIVSTINQLFSRIKSNEINLSTIIKNVGAIIIDEAHRATSQMYDGFLKKCEEICGKELFPICGLTATPGRSGLHSEQETYKLIGRFDAYLIKPDLGEGYDKDPLRYFREEKYLAKAIHVLIKSGREYQLTDQEIEEMKNNFEQDLPPTFLKRLSYDKGRNLQIIKKLIDLPSGSKTLVYACTVDHAYFISTILNSKGRKAGAISSETSDTLRRALINDFKKGNLEFLCNFGVLTTGFDAPKTENIALCRPTTSEVLYEQIIGRGMRGPKFFGTEKCVIYDFAENILRLGPPLAYARYDWKWSEERIE